MSEEPGMIDGRICARVKVNVWKNEDYRLTLAIFHDAHSNYGSEDDASDEGDDHAHCQHEETHAALLAD